MIGDPPSLLSFFEQWSRKSGPFLQDEGDHGARRLSYAEAAESVQRFRLRLHAARINQGERILIWSENRAEWIVVLWACLLEGVVAVPIDYRSSAALVRKIGAIVDAKALVAGASVPSDAADELAVWPLDELTDLPASSALPALQPAAPDQLAEVLFTSGATGEPKGVTLTHRNILANLKPIDAGVEKYRRYIGPFSPIRFLNLLPLSHMFGQSMAAFIPPMIGGTVIFTSGFSPRAIVRLVKRRRVSVVVCVPQMLEVLRDYLLAEFPETAEPPKRNKWYWAWWQYRRIHRATGWKFWAFVVGAAPLGFELEAWWRKLGYVVIQGYGLTETAPVATLNHPFNTRQGSVGKPIEGVEVRIASDGEIFLRGENVTPGYFGDAGNTALDNEGWFHTGDIGEQDPEGRLTIKGRKKEMIVSSDGLNVFPQDVERALDAQRGVVETAVVGRRREGREEVHAVLVLNPGAEVEAIVRQANETLEVHQRVRGYSIWPEPALPRTSGTGKLKRGEVAQWVNGQRRTDAQPSEGKGGTAQDIIGRYAGGRQVTAATTIDELGLSSLDRVQLLMELETRTGATVEEGQFAQARTVGDLLQKSGGSGSNPLASGADASFEFPEWSRSLPARGLRRLLLPSVILPLARAWAWIRVNGADRLRTETGPVIFASNHQSHFDLPSILWALPSHYRHGTATAMSKEFFEPHFHPRHFSVGERFRSSLMYYLSCLLLNTFPLPQRESGARSALRYASELVGDGWSIVIFPEGKRTDAGEIHPFQPGVGMLAARLSIPVVPVRLRNLEKVLHKDARFPTPGAASVTFGVPVRYSGTDYIRIAREIQQAVEHL